MVLKKIALVLYPNAIKTKKTPIKNLTKNIRIGCKLGKNINNEEKLPKIEAKIKRLFLTSLFIKTALESSKK